MRTSLSADVHAPAAARTFVNSALVDLDSPPPPRDDVVLVVSELVTNSVRAGASGIEVHLEVLDDCVELQVGDDAPGWPAAHHASVGDLGGRGLEIVGKIADSWHATRQVEGKRVIVTWSRAE